MKRNGIALSLAVLLCLSAMTGVPAAAGDSGEIPAGARLSEYETGEVLVEYADGTLEVVACTDEENLAAELQELRAREDVTNVQPNYTYQVDGLSTSDALAGQQWALSNDGTFAMVENRNQYPVFDSPFSVPSLPGQWRMPWNFGAPGGRQRMRGMAYGYGRTGGQTTAVQGVDVNAEEAWRVYNGGVRDVVIALIDTGVDAGHEDLQGILWTNSGEIAGNGRDDDGNGYADDVNGWDFYHDTRLYAAGSEDSHGTHGAGTMLANQNNGTGIAGIVNSSHVKLMSLKALGGADGSGTSESIIRAIRYAEENGASICNLSLGGSMNDPALYRAIANSRMLFVVAAGNDGTDTDRIPSYPAGYDLDNILAVANLSYDGTLHYSSSYGLTSVDLAAPGTYILSTTPGNGYSYMSGTSMAAPMVTAAAAMVYSADAGLTLADVKEILLRSARPLDSLTGNVASGGMLDLGAAMTFDRSALSGADWKPLEPGRAPKISIRRTTQQGRTLLTVKVTDPDGDLASVEYFPGAWTASQLSPGLGTPFALDAGGSALLIADVGTYTFYAVDQKGNETTRTVTTDSALWQRGYYRGGVASVSNRTQ